ncbi:acyl-CoA dehydrogenase family protein [Microtetraspora sp. NBRC 16547]|uniref:acyl-CoA dehydrogenase family protein n=1 Tax=Microtetraspora sp. NBRC 16547 TaxID=3030993 RepID=UPI0024A330D0|nr:acyl-CoA dehydrogenase family protein [Microtetraspora sp. NBRC 16547]GLW99323.1 acyl-CoA dehydrogenase [Microtetraspora sp. NBRC 16547]
MALYDDEHDQFRSMVKAFIERSVEPKMERWNEAGIVDRSFFTEAGSVGLLGHRVPTRWGGPGIDDYRFSAVLLEELCRPGHASLGCSLTLQNDVVLGYLLSLADDAQCERWLPGVVTGDKVLAVAMTEPNTGSDLGGIATKARREGDTYVVNGAKTFISNGHNADIFVVVVRTSEDRHRGLSLLVVERDTPGFTVGRNLSKLGLHAQDTSELAFDDAVVPAENLLGEEGGGFAALMSNLPEERLDVAVMAVAAAEGAFERTLNYVKNRKAFGQPIGSFQNSRFVMAEIATELTVARTYIDHCVQLHVDGKLTPEEAAKAKWWTTELQFSVAHRCLQLHGGYGFMTEYSISRDFADARVQTIYGGTTEIMKEVIGRSLGL